MRVSISAQNLEVVREDIASVAVRHVVVSRPGDQDVRIPANGFRLAGTISPPAGAGKGPLPAVILVGGSGPADRDETVYGIPIFGQLAGSLADAGFLVLRYDKRAVGQSGGRAESATLDDFADDLLAVVAAVRRMSTVDRKRIAVVGRSEGGAVALLAAAKQKDIAALALVSSMGTTGAELNMWQVTHGLERSTQTTAEKATTVDLQKRIQQAVITGSGWDSIPPQYRQQADVPWFKSFLIFDPANAMARVSQPVLVVHGLLDAQVPASNAERLEELARRRKKGSVEVVKIPGVNHLLAPATTGELEEYATLPDRRVSPAVGDALVSWLKKTFAAAR
jgi:dipeptidyl aminopeptidase/acylaminoacyl peptidase